MHHNVFIPCESLCFLNYIGSTMMSGTKLLYYYINIKCAVCCYYRVVYGKQEEYPSPAKVSVFVSSSNVRFPTSFL